MSELVIRCAEARVSFAEETGFSIGILLEASNGVQTEAFVSREHYQTDSAELDFQAVSQAVKRASLMLCRQAEGHLLSDMESLEKVIDTYLGKNPDGVCECAALSYAALKLRAKASGTDVARCLAGENELILPVPSCLCASGGNRYGDSLAMDDKPKYYFLAYGFHNYEEASYQLWETMHCWEKLLTERFSVLYEHGAGMFIPAGHVRSDIELLDMMAQVIEKAGNTGRVGIGLDLCTDSFYDPRRKLFRGLFDNRDKNLEAVTASLAGMAKEYPLMLIACSFGKNRPDAYAAMKADNRAKILVPADELPDTAAIHPGKQGLIDGAIIRLGKIPKISTLVQLCRDLKKDGLIFALDDSLISGICVPDLAAALGAWTAPGYGIDAGGNRLLAIEAGQSGICRFAGLSL